jgi:DNA processing protein
LNAELLYQVALTLVPQVGPVQSRILVDHIGSAKAIFKTPVAKLELIEGIGSIRAKNIHRFKNFNAAEKEIAFIEKYKIRPLFINDNKYPRRLLNCYDPPTILYYKGTADLNTSRIVSIIGTRSNTEYGRQVTENLICDLSAQNILVLSGLAFGIDAIAHRAALKNELQTVAVLAHGLDTIYPGQHSSLAKEMIRSGGGLLTEFGSYTKPDKHNFPTRNRIVAGMSDAVVVIESGLKGGSMVTAELANGYNKDVFAFPARVTDIKSAGCNYLIQNNKAMLITNARDVMLAMGWEEQRRARSKQQKELFVHLSAHEQVIVEQLRKRNECSIDELNICSGLSTSNVAAALLNLELQNIIRALPGKRYRLID